MPTLEHPPALSRATLLPKPAMRQTSVNTRTQREVVECHSSSPLTKSAEFSGRSTSPRTTKPIWSTSTRDASRPATRPARAPAPRGRLGARLRGLPDVTPRATRSLDFRVAQ